MKPEKKQTIQIELEDEEKLIIDFLKINDSKMDLGVLKVKTELSGKKWDSAMKSLAKHGLVKVSSVDDIKVVELSGTI